MTGPACHTCGAPVDAATCRSVPHPGAPWALLCDPCFASGPGPLHIATLHAHLEPRQLRGQAAGLRLYADRPALYSAGAAARRAHLLALADAWDRAAAIVATAIAIVACSRLQVQP